MRPIVALRLFFAFCVIAVSGGPAGAAESPPPLVTLRFGPVYEPTIVDKDEVVVRVPISVADRAQPAGIGVRLLTASVSKQHDKRLVEAFKPRMEKEQKDLGPAIEIAINVARLPAPATYDVVLEAKWAKEKAQELALQITIPAAKLAAATQLTIVQERPYIFGEAHTKEATALTLKETGKRSRVTDAKVSHLRTDKSPRATSATILLNEALPTLAPGEARDVPYKLSAQFPLGTTKGIAEINARELPDALTVNYEVLARRPKTTILFIVILGLIAGHLLRTRLRQVIELNEIRLKAIDLQLRYQQERGRHEDQTFHDALIEPERRLVDVRRTGKTAEDVRQAINHATNALDEALEVLRGSRAKVQSEWDAMSTMVSASRSLPPAAQFVATAARTLLEEARVALSKANLDVTKAKLDALRQKMNEGLSGFIEHWKPTMEGYCDAVEGAGTTLPAAANARLKVAVDAARSLVAVVKEPAPTLQAADLQATVIALDAAHDSVTYMFGQLALLLGRTLREAADVLQKVPDADPDALARLRQLAAPLGEAWQTNLENSHEALAALDATLAAVSSAAAEVVLSLLPHDAASETARKRLTELMGQGKYVEAAREVTALRRPKVTSEGTVAGTRRGVDGDTPEDIVYLDAIGAGRQFGRWTQANVTHIERPEDPLPGLELERARTFREISQATMRRTIGAGSLIAVVGYLVFANTFVGTLNDWGLIFFWAFGLDLTADAVVSAAQRIK